MIKQDLQESTIEGYIELWEIDANHLGLGILRFTADITQERQPVSFGGNIYFPYPIKIEGLGASVEGSNERPTLSISSATRDITILLIANKGLQGAKVQRIRTLAKYLDDGETPDTTAHLPIDSYVIDSMSDFQPSKYATFELVNALDMENIFFPTGQIIRSYCYYKYRVWNAKDGSFTYAQGKACPYVDARYYDDENNPTSIALDKCSKTLDGCRLRFGANAVLPFGGYPGIAQNY